jgi:hypothetical protein
MECSGCMCETKTTTTTTTNTNNDALLLSPHRPQQITYIL